MATQFAKRFPGGASHSAYNPRIVKRLDGTTYRDSEGYYYMYYTASNGADNTDYDATGLAISKDLENWTKVSVDGPVLPRGRPGAVDAGDASAVTVLHDGKKFLMWHEANATPPGETGGDYVRIAYAESIDGRKWVKSGWVIAPGVTDYDRLDVYAPVVIKDGAVWKMWYTGHDASDRFAVMYATAPNPSGPWARAWNSFVFHPSNSTFPSEVWKEGDALFMTYGSVDGMWLAKMINGTWTPLKNISTVRQGSWDSREPGSWPSLAVKGNVLYLFYGANVYYQGGIGFRKTPLTVDKAPPQQPISYIPVEIKGPSNNGSFASKRIPQVWGYCDSKGGHVSVALGSFVATAGCVGNKFVVDNFDHIGGPGNVGLRAQQSRPDGTISSHQINVYFNF